MSTMSAKKKLSVMQFVMLHCKEICSLKKAMLIGRMTKVIAIRRTIQRSQYHLD